MGRVGRDRKALLRGLEKYNALLPSPMHVSEVCIKMTEHPPNHTWMVSYGIWHGHGDTIMGAANDAASRMPTVVKASELKSDLQSGYTFPTIQAAVGQVPGPCDGEGNLGWVDPPPCEFEGCAGAAMHDGAHVPAEEVSGDGVREEEVAGAVEAINRASPEVLAAVALGDPGGPHADEARAKLDAQAGEGAVDCRHGVSSAHCQDCPTLFEGESAAEIVDELRARRTEARDVTGALESHAELMAGMRREGALTEALEAATTALAAQAARLDALELAAEVLCDSATTAVSDVLCFRAIRECPQLLVKLRKVQQNIDALREAMR